MLHKRDYVLVGIVFVLAALLVALWLRPTASPFYEDLLPYDVRNDILPGSGAEVMDALNRIIFMLGQADAMRSLLQNSSWHERWRTAWTTVFEGTRGGLHDTAVVCLRYGETRLLSDLLACVNAAESLRE